MKLHAFVAGAAFAALTSIAHAAVIERTFDVEASGFTLASGSSDPAPVDPVTLNFTLIWDPSTVIAPTDFRPDGQLLQPPVFVGIRQ